MKKKLLISIIGLSMAASLIGCQGNNSNNEKESQNVSTAQEEEKAESKNNSDSEKPDDELSQAEWMEKYGDEEGKELGHTIVDKINMTYEDKTIAYDHIEKYTKDTGEQILLVYFDFTNNSSEECSVSSFFNFIALQNDEVINLYSYNIYNDEIDECIDNIVNQIPSGSTVKVAQILELTDWTSPVKIRVNDANAFNQDMTKQQMQQQEINIQ